MTASAPFTGFYSKALRNVLPCLSGQELKVFVAVASYSDEQGKAWPGVRELADVTTYPPNAISDLLDALEVKGLVLTLRKTQRDPLTGRMVPDVYIVNPEIVLISDLSLWIENRLRHVSIPESTFPVNSAQADRITEAESENQKQRSRITAPEGAALLSNANTPHRPNTTRQNAGAASTAGSQRQPNSRAQRQTIPPTSALPPLAHTLTFAESVAVNAIRREVPDMGHEKATELIARYGVDQFTAAVLSYKKRNAKTPILRPTGWIIRNLESGVRK